jgi:general secretion pathway protein C
LASRAAPSRQHVIVRYPRARFLVELARARGLLSSCAMLAAVKQAGIAMICAAFGFAAGLTARRDPPSPSPRPSPSPSPSTSMASCPAPAPCPAPVALVPPLPPTRVSPPSPALTSTPAPLLLERTTTARRETPLAAFRFVGIGPFGGLRLARVRPGTLPAALGLQTGDELLTINDFRMSDPEQALTAYARLRYADRLNLVVARNGQKTAIVYFVR